MAIIRLQDPFVIDSLTIKSISEVYKIAEQYYIKKLPFDIERLISLLGIEVCFEDLEKSISGYIENRTSGWIIAVNKYHSPRRQRFTLAHECCHYLLHKEEIEKNKHISKTLFRDKTTNDMENEANRFASEILIPEEEFKKQVEMGKRNFQDLASIFNVSIAAVRYRAYKLNYIPRF